MLLFAVCCNQAQRRSLSRNLRQLSFLSCLVAPLWWRCAQRKWQKCGSRKKRGKDEVFFFFFFPSHSVWDQIVWGQSRDVSCSSSSTGVCFTLYLQHHFSTMDRYNNCVFLVDFSHSWHFLYCFLHKKEKQSVMLITLHCICPIPALLVFFLIWYLTILYCHLNSSLNYFQHIFKHCLSDFFFLKLFLCV